MNKRRRYRAVLVLGAISLVVVVTGGLWLRSARRQEALNRQLIAALVKKDPNQALALVDAGADPNTPLKSLPPPSLTQLWNHLIHRAPPPRSPSPSAFLLVCGASTYDDYRHPCLTTDEPQLAEAMLEHGAYKNAEDGSRETSVMLSVIAKHPKTMDLLLNHGADVNARDQNGYTALEQALDLYSFTDTPEERSQIASIARQLLAHGADPNVSGADGKTLLQLVQHRDQSDIVFLLKQVQQDTLNRMLIDAMVDYDFNLKGPDFPKALVLVKAGADANTRLKIGLPPNPHPVSKSLLHRPHPQGNQGPSALLLACGATWSEHVYGRDGSITMTTVHGGTTSDPIELVRAMLQHGADADAKDRDGETPLMYAARYQNQKTLDALLKHGVNVNATSDYIRSPLTCAVLSSHSSNDAAKNIILRLLAHGADPNLADDRGRTPLDYARRLGFPRPDLVALLKQAGAKK
jgi:ankyrin repeat protein